MLVFFVQLLFYFLFFVLLPLPIAVLINKHVKNNSLFAFSASIGLALPLSALLLNYLFLFLNPLPKLIYLLVIFGLFMVLFFTQKKYIQSFVLQIYSEFLSLFGKYSLISLIVLFTFIVGQISYSIFKPFTEHDSFEYAIQGRIFAKDLSIQYVKYRIDLNSGFFYVGLHGFLYPLIYSLENIFSSFVLNPTDSLFKGLNNFYSLFILILIGTYFKNKSLKLSWIVLLTLIFFYSFVFTALQTSIDHLRIYLLMVFILLWKENITNFNYSLTAILFIVLGLSANTHSLNMIIACFLFLAWSIQQLMNKGHLGLIFFALFSFIAGGSFHYIIDTFWGSGWIFNF
jgi:hypothetical protein